jgi:hypothetical protein
MGGDAIVADAIEHFVTPIDKIICGWVRETEKDTIMQRKTEKFTLIGIGDRAHCCQPCEKTVDAIQNHTRLPITSSA